MTFGEIKDITLQKIDEADNSDKEAMQEYTRQMPAACNEALQLLSTAGKYIVKKLDITAALDQDTQFDLKELAADFYSVSDVYKRGLSGYRQTLDYRIEGERYFTAPAQDAQYRVYYNAYPSEITSATPDGEELTLDPEVAVLVPFYIASQILKFDDVSLATMLRNEFEAGRDELRARSQNKIQGRGEFMNLEWY